MPLGEIFSARSQNQTRSIEINWCGQKSTTMGSRITIMDHNRTEAADNVAS